MINLFPFFIGFFSALHDVYIISTLPVKFPDTKSTGNLVIRCDTEGYRRSLKTYASKMTRNTLVIWSCHDPLAAVSQWFGYRLLVINHNRELWSGSSSWHAISMQWVIWTPCMANYYGDKTCILCCSLTLTTQAVSYDYLSLRKIIHLTLILVGVCVGAGVGGQLVAMDFIHTVLGGRGTELKHVGFKYTTCPCRKFCFDVGVVCKPSGWKGHTRNLTHDVDCNMW